mgnify:CR=1 FL=1
MTTPSSPRQRILDHLTFLYGPDRAPALMGRLKAILEDFRRRNPHLARKGPARRDRLTERDAVLITYGDQVTAPGKRPLVTLAELLERHAAGAITIVHLLPFFPYSSDDGFSVIDYTAVNPALGTWEDVERVGRRFRLMFDAVINHISVQSRWFQEFLRGNPEYAEFFITVEEGTDLSMVVRPRALPLLHPFQTAEGEKWVWTTFSADQVDLNYANPEVLLRIVEVLLFYVEKGAEIIRLDAIAYLWKKLGTPCIHLEETHRVVKLFRAVLDEVAPHVLLITETNVPHAENVSYFGNGYDEAQLVYQFPLPPLVLHAFLTGDATHLSTWASGLSTPSDETTFFNFLASHDGIGVRPVEGFLSPGEIQALVDRTLAHGGYVSYKTNPDGTESVYELNISYFDALSDPKGEEPLDLQVRRFLTSQAVMLSLAGVPGIYVHSLFGSRGDPEAVERTGQYRSINRAKFDRRTLEQELVDPKSLRHRVFYPYRHLLAVRAAHPAFHPNGPQQVVNAHPSLFALLRTAPDHSISVLCIHNVAGTEVALELDVAPWTPGRGSRLRDLISGRQIPIERGRLRCRVAPYEVLWLTETEN